MNQPLRNESGWVRIDMDMPPDPASVARCKEEAAARRLRDLRAIDLATELICKQGHTPETEAAMEALHRMAVEIVKPKPKHPLVAYAEALALVAEMIAEEGSRTYAADERAELAVALKIVHDLLGGVDLVARAAKAGCTPKYHPLRFDLPFEADEMH